MNQIQHSLVRTHRLEQPNIWISQDGNAGLGTTAQQGS